MRQLSSIITVIGLIMGCGTAVPSLAAPLGYTPPEYLEHANRPTPEWSKGHPRLTTQQTPNVSHSCSKNLHTQRCIKHCVERSQKIQRTQSVDATVAQVAGVAHNCKKDVHSPRCIEHCAKNLATPDTADVTHSCTNAVHSPKCIKKCVIKTTEIKPAGPSPIWHVRGGTAFPVRDQKAEDALLFRLYNQHVKGNLIKPTNQ